MRNKECFPTDEIPHIWAHGNYQSDTKKARNGSANIFSEDDKIYSFGYHYTIARIVRDEKIVFINRHKYSNTTQKHRWKVRRALPSDYTVFEVSSPEKTTSALFWETFKDAAENIYRSIDAESRARTTNPFFDALCELEDLANLIEVCIRLGYGNKRGFLTKKAVRNLKSRLPMVYVNNKYHNLGALKNPLTKSSMLETFQAMFENIAGREDRSAAEIFFGVTEDELFAKMRERESLANKREEAKKAKEREMWAEKVQEYIELAERWMAGTENRMIYFRFPDMLPEKYRGALVRVKDGMLQTSQGVSVPVTPILCKVVEMALKNPNGCTIPDDMPKINGIYEVLRWDGNVLVIGCHRFYKPEIKRAHGLLCQ